MFGRCCCAEGLVNLFAEGPAPPPVCPVFVGFTDNAPLSATLTATSQYNGGVVSFYLNNVLKGTATVVNGVATLAVTLASATVYVGLANITVNGTTSVSCNTITFSTTFPPPCPVLVNPTAGRVAYGATATLTATAIAESTSVKFFLDGVLAGTGTLASGVWSLVLTGLLPGTHTWYATAVGPGGESSGCGPGRSFFLIPTDILTAIAAWDMDESDTNMVTTVREDDVGTYDLTEASKTSFGNLPATAALNAVGVRGGTTKAALMFDSGNPDHAPPTSDNGFLLRSIVLAGDALPFASGDSFTIEGFFKAAYTAPGTAPYTILRIGDAPTSTPTGLTTCVWIFINVDGTVVFIDSQPDANFNQYVAGAVYSSDTYAHVLVRKNQATGKIQISVNGSAFTSTNSTTTNNTQQEINWGYAPSVTGSYFRWNPALNYWRMYRSALSDTTKDFLYNGGQGRTNHELNFV